LNSNNWYVAQLKPNGLLRAQRNLKQQDFHSFNPSRVETISVRNTRKPLPRPLFPGYLFVQFQSGQNGWQTINSTRGVARLILNDFRNPRPLPSAFMAELMARCDIAGAMKPPENIKPGDRIRVLSGPFADLVTTVEQLDKDSRIQVLIDLMGRSVNTSLPKNIVERISPPAVDAAAHSRL
jgi:transcriptional antiterminator RfaH